MTIYKMDIPNVGEVLFTGPSIEEGPKPTIFYFALSAEDSLGKDPYNQPVQFSEGSPFRIFSMTLPGHENNLPPENALNVWAERMAQGEKVIPDFIEKVVQAIQALSHHFEGGTLSVMGLSRGAFIACHVAAACPLVKNIVGYAPLTKLSYAKEFKILAGKALDLEHLIPKLYDRSIRFYIGNNDTRVGTDHAFSLIHSLAKTAQESKIRIPPIEMLIYPSVGRHGHGTPPKIFKNGIDYLKRKVSK